MFFMRNHGRGVHVVLSAQLCLGGCFPVSLPQGLSLGYKTIQAVMGPASWLFMVSGLPWWVWNFIGS